MEQEYVENTEAEILTENDVIAAEPGITDPEPAPKPKISLDDLKAFVRCQKTNPKTEKEMGSNHHFRSSGDCCGFPALERSSSCYQFLQNTAESIGQLLQQKILFQSYENLYQDDKRLLREGIERPNKTTIQKFRICISCGGCARYS